jgi:magnesium-protoporphyrin O-methyltransferase
VSDCCSPAGYRHLFNRREARRRLDRYRKKGLDPMARAIRDELVRSDVAGKTVLEVGGGVGELHVELLKAGAGGAVNVELSSGYERAATELLEDEGLAGAVQRRVGDFVVDAPDLDTADVVVMNRVVCCYPDMEGMMRAAAEKAGEKLALTFPRDRWSVRTAVTVGNWWLRVRSVDFQAYVHDPEGIVAVADAGGLRMAFADEDRVWRALVLERAA